jgi:RNA polymerase sigma factor (sigma-70 family)
MRTDRSLARRAAAGDNAAFEAIFRRYHQELYRYCRAILRSEDDARDALQSTMVAALRALPGDECEIALKPWLYRVAHNEAISILRAREPLVDPSEASEGHVPGADQELDDRVRL